MREASITLPLILVLDRIDGMAIITGEYAFKYDIDSIDVREILRDIPEKITIHYVDDDEQ